MENGGMGACPKNVFEGNTMLNVGKRRFALWARLGVTGK